MKKLLAMSLLSLTFVAGNAHAQIFDGWAGEASLTGSKTTGNTDTTDVGLGLKLAKTGETWTHKFKAAADLGEAADVTNKKRYNLGYQIDRELNDRTYIFASGDYFSDDFGSYQEGYFVGAGLGYKVVVTDPITWNVEGGLGFRSQQEQGALGVRTEELAGRAMSDFDWILNDNVSLYNDTELTYASSDTYIWNETGLTAQIAGNLAARISYRIDHHTDVPAGVENTDTISRIGIVYTMK